MSKQFKPVRMAIGATIGLGLLLGTACGGGSGTGEGVQAASAAKPAAEVGPAATDPPTTEAPTTVPETVAPTTTAKPVTARAATPPTQAQSATTAATAAPAATPAATAPPATPAPTAPPVTLPARPNPSTPEVMAAVAQFKTKVPLFSPTEAQARQFGDMVCDAFDAGQTYSQVKSTALAQVAAVPFLTVSSADADFILKTTVKLFCPAYSSKLP